MRVLLSNSEFLLSVILWLGSLVVCYGLREGLYSLSAWVMRRETRFLKPVLDPNRKTVFGERLLLTVLDPVLSWLSVGLVLLAYSLVLLLVLPDNVLLYTIVIFMMMFCGVIFPIRLFIRVYHWLTGTYAKQNLWLRMVFSTISLLGSLVAFYVIFFSVLGLCFPFVQWVASWISPFAQTIFRQAYIQHIQAVIPVTGMAILYVLIHGVIHEYRLGNAN